MEEEKERINIEKLLEEDLDELEVDDNDSVPSQDIAFFLKSSLDHEDNEDILESMEALKSDGDALFSAVYHEPNSDEHTIVTEDKPILDYSVETSSSHVINLPIVSASKEFPSTSPTISQEIVKEGNHSHKVDEEPATEQFVETHYYSQQELSEHRRIVQEVVRLMVDSIENLAGIFHAPAPLSSTFSTSTSSLSLFHTPVLDTPTLLLDEFESQPPSSPSLPSLPLQGEGERSGERLKQQILAQEREEKKRAQLEENHDELLLKLLVDAETERLEADRREREERARRREEVFRLAKREAGAVSLQRTWRGKRARKVCRPKIVQRVREKEEERKERERWLMEREEEQMKEIRERINRELKKERKGMEEEDTQSVSLRSLPLYRRGVEVEEVEESLPLPSPLSVSPSLPLSLVPPSLPFSKTHPELRPSLIDKEEGKTTPSLSPSLIPRPPSPHQERGERAPPRTLAPPSKGRKASVVQSIAWGGSFSTAAWGAGEGNAGGGETAPLFSLPLGGVEEERAERCRGEEEEEGEDWYGIDEDKYEFEEGSVGEGEEVGEGEREEIGKRDQRRGEEKVERAVERVIKKKSVITGEELGEIDEEEYRRDWGVNIKEEKGGETLPLSHHPPLLSTSSGRVDNAPLQVLEELGQESRGTERDRQGKLLRAYEVWREEYLSIYEQNKALFSSSSSSKRREEEEQSSARDEGEGAIREVDYSVEDLQDFDYILQTYGTSLSKLTLNVNKLTTLQGVQALSSLQSLSLVDNQLTGIPELSSLSSLHFLNIDSNRVSDLSPLAQHTGLQILSANCNNLHHFPSLFCTNLYKLDLYKNRIQDIPCHPKLKDDLLSMAPTTRNFQSLLTTSISPSWHLPKLLYLNLGRNQLKSVDGKSLSSCVYLQTLILSQNQLATLPSPLHLACLTSLWLNGNQIENLSPWEQQNQPTSANTSNANNYPLFLPSLQKLYLQDNRINSLSFSVFTYMPVLQELDLSFNQVASLEYCYDYDEMSLPYLSNCKINDNPMTTGRQNQPNTNANNITAAANNANNNAANVNTNNNSANNSTPSSRSTLSSASFFETPLTSLLSRAQQLQDAVTFNDWQTFFLLLCPALTLLSNVEIPLKKRVPNQFHRASLFTPQEQQLVHLLSQMRTETDLLQHKLKKRQLKIKKEAEQKAGSSSQSIGTEQREEFLCNLAIWQCDRLAHLFMHDKAAVNPRQMSLILFAEQSPLLPVLLSAQNNTEAREKSSLLSNALIGKGVIRLQSVVRGFLVRMKIKKLFADIRYEDDELDDILNQNDEDLLNLAEFEDDFFLDESGQGKGAMVYGDHIRLRSRGKDGKEKGAESWITPSTELMPPPSFAPNHFPSQSQSSSRAVSRPPSSASSHMSAVTEQSGALLDDEEESSCPPSVPKGGKKQRLQEEWGITDPKVLKALMKRNKRMKQFMSAAETREKEKHASVRYERFVKKTQGISGSSTGSVGGGTQFHTHRNNHNNKRGESIKSQHVTPAAWLRADQDK